MLARGPEVPNAERMRVARLLIRAIWMPFLTDGVIHADPHPGNFILMPDGRMAVLDFGSVKELSRAWVDVNRRMFPWILISRPAAIRLPGSRWCRRISEAIRYRRIRNSASS